MHPASKNFPPVEELDEDELRIIARSAPKNFLYRSAREVAAQKELCRRVPTCRECWGEIIWSPHHDEICDSCYATQ